MTRFWLARTIVSLLACGAGAARCATSLQPVAAASSTLTLSAASDLAWLRDIFPSTSSGQNEVCWKFDKNTSDVNPLAIIANTFYFIRLFMATSATVNIEGQQGNATRTASTTLHLSTGPLVRY